MLLLVLGVLGPTQAAEQPQTSSADTIVGSVGASLVGLWRTIDERSHKPTSLVRLSWDGEQLTGKVEKILKAGVSPTARCVKCKGELKDAPLLGLTILSGLREEGDALVGGEVLDPSTGKVYRAKITVRDAAHIELRGYLGIPALGRSQVWERFEAAKEQK